MPLEANVQFISDLEPTYPLQEDGMGQGDDHFRNIKKAIKATFPNINGAITGTVAQINYYTANHSIFQGIVDGTDTSRTIPSGVIVMWSGSPAAVPTGWSVCDGTNGTPDLRDRFVLGSPDGTTGAAGTSHTATTNNAGSHNHTGSTQSHALTLAEIPEHRHLGGDHNEFGTGDFENSVGLRNRGDDNHTVRRYYTSYAGGNQGHSHVITDDGLHSHEVDTKGKHYKLAFIMKD